LPDRSLPPLALCGEGADPEDLLVHPPQERAIELQELLTRNVRQHGPTLAFVHQIPHRRDRRLPPALVGDLRFIGDEMEFAAAMAEATLLDLMGAHERLAGVNGCAESGGHVRA
jgi:hypothetical protein